MPTVSFDATGVTVVHAFSVEPSSQADVAGLLAALTAEVISRLPGYRWASVQQSCNGKQVLHLSQWRDQRDWELMLRHAEVRLRMKDVLDLAKDEVNVYEGADVWGPALPGAA